MFLTMCCIIHVLMQVEVEDTILYYYIILAFLVIIAVTFQFVDTDLKLKVVKQANIDTTI